MDTSKARRAALAVNRRLPPDDIVRRDYYVERLKFAEIAHRHNVSEAAVRYLFKRRGWPRERPALPAEASIARGLIETREKIVVRREVMLDCREFRLVSIAISLPRIPTLHGHFAGA